MEMGNTHFNEIIIMMMIANMVKILLKEEKKIHLHKILLRKCLNLLEMIK